MDIPAFIPPQYSGLLFLAVGLLLRLFVGSRRFARRGIGGMQHFSGYFIALLLTFLEGIAALAGSLSIGIGLLMLALEYLHGTLF